MTAAIGTVTGNNNDLPEALDIENMQMFNDK